MHAAVIPLSVSTFSGKRNGAGCGWTHAGQEPLAWSARKINNYGRIVLNRHTAMVPVQWLIGFW